VIEHKKPRFHTGYFSVLDEVQHAAGPYTREAFATIEALDAMVGTVWQAALQADPRTVDVRRVGSRFARYDKISCTSTAPCVTRASSSSIPKASSKSWRADPVGQRRRDAQQSER